MFENIQKEPEPAYIGLPTYLKLPYTQSKEELRKLGADIAIVGAPFDMGVVNRPGARFGPRAIRSAAYLGSDWLYHLGLGVEPLKHVTVVDFGDANCPPNVIEKSHDAIRTKVAETLEAGALPIVLGGDHSITYPSATAVAQHYGYGKVGMIHFDSHADTGDDIFGGCRLSHGSPMRRLISDGAIPGRNFVQIGLRGYWPPPDILQWMREQGMQWHLMAEIEERGFDAVLEEAIREVLKVSDKIYLTVDIDVLDPAFAPGTGTPEPGGLTTLQLLKGVRQIVSRVNLVAMDLVEVSPPYDGPGAGGITAEVANRIVLEAISTIAWKRAREKE